MSIVHFYPDAHPESTSMDSSVFQLYTLGSGVDWSTIISASGNDPATGEDAAEWCFYIRADNVNNKWVHLGRGIMLFDTSALPDTATILSAKLTLYGFTKNDDSSCSPSLNIYSVNPASNTETAAGDFDSFGASPYCNTPVSYDNLGVFSPPDNFGTTEFVLNATGLAAISKTGVTKIGLRNANYDVTGSAPNWVSGAVSSYSVRSADDITERRPTLEVEYTIATKSLHRVTGLTHIYDRTGKKTKYRLKVYMGGLAPSPEITRIEE